MICHTYGNVFTYICIYSQVYVCMPRAEFSTSVFRTPILANQWTVNVDLTQPNLISAHNLLPFFPIFVSGHTTTN